MFGPKTGLLGQAKTHGRYAHGQSGILLPQTGQDLHGHGRSGQRVPRAVEIQTGDALPLGRQIRKPGKRPLQGHRLGQFVLAAKTNPGRGLGGHRQG